MKICFILGQNESLGIEYLSSFLKQNGQKVDLLFDPCLFNDSITSIPWLAQKFSRESFILSEIKKIQPDLIGFQVFTDTLPWNMHLAEYIKKHYPLIKIVFGGIHPTSVPEEMLQHECVDFVIRGEGEHALLELMQTLSQQKNPENIKNLSYRDNNRIIHHTPLRPLISNLDTLPFPDKELFYTKALPTKGYKIMTSRGCPFNCSYCYNHVVKELYGFPKNFVRRRSVKNVIDELVIAKNRWRTNKIFFDDDIFISDKEWLEEFVAEYIEKITLPNFCFVHPVYINEKTINLLKKMNTQLVEIGIQTIDPEYRKKIYQRHYSQEQLKKALHLIYQSKIPCIADNIIDYETITEEEALRITQFYLNEKICKVYLFNLRIFPHTQIAHLLNRKKELPVPKEEQNYFSIVKAKRLKNIQKIFIMILFGKIFPKRFTPYLLKTRLYRFFPLLNYHFLLELFYAIEISLRRKALFNRETSSKYIRYILKKIFRRF
ncbi:MAG: cobalamin-dependent protein [Candidatus Aureabacteria bacterium]|nr:cobalamin-dependent protein [Candidatus Auribacterota bacterium]